MSPPSAVRREERLAPHPGAVQFPGRGEPLRRLLLPRSRRLLGCWRVRRSTPARDRSFRHWSCWSSQTSSPLHRGTTRTLLGQARRRSNFTYPCEVAGGSSLAEPWDDSSSAEALGSLTAGTWRPGRTLHVAASVLAEAMYAVVAPRIPMGKRGPETERSHVGAAAISPVIASRCEATRAGRRRSVRACPERWPESRRHRGAEGPATSTWADAGA
jgi:hypothetical protein